MSLLSGCQPRGTPPAPGLDRVLDPVPARAVPDSAMRWLDVAGAPYGEAFRTPRFYEPTDRRYVRVEWASQADTFRGRIVMRGLKPNFAYQLKLMGRAGVMPGDPTPEALASRRLGELGRWWSAVDDSNVADCKLEARLRAGADVRGYLLFDFLVTDRNGDCVREFALDSSYHVLWRSDQRTRGRTDSPYHEVRVDRGHYGYASSDTPAPETVRVFAEREGQRPRPGNIILPPGEYPVLINITEESFHANQKVRVQDGGFWAQVLEGPVDFVISRAVREPQTSAGRKPSAP
ncbi:MAG: hypothetical protein HPY44_17865 [Armatimonadetes bacterium]|nr:hypothetical protein [Armatimonadota bacterium]